MEERWRLGQRLIVSLISGLLCGEAVGERRAGVVSIRFFRLRLCIMRRGRVGNDVTYSLPVTNSYWVIPSARSGGLFKIASVSSLRQLCYLRIGQDLTKSSKRPSSTTICATRIQSWIWTYIRMKDIITGAIAAAFLGRGLLMARRVVVIVAVTTAIAVTIAALFAVAVASFCHRCCFLLL